MRIKVLFMVFYLLITGIFAKGGIVAYIPEYRNTPTNAQLDYLTHVILFSIAPGSGGTISGSLDSRINEVLPRAHARGVKVSVCLGGGSRTGSFPTSVQPANRAAFVANIKNYVESRGIDGIDLDWEFPNTQTERSNFSAFIVDLKAALGPDKTVTFAIGAGHSHNDFSNDVWRVIDALHVMTYDFQRNVPGQHHAPYNGTTAKMNEWINSGKIAKEKLYYGVPFYGIRPDPNPATTWSEANVQTYAQLMGRPSGKAALSQLDVVDGFYFDGIPAMKRKTKFAYDAELGGIMVWEIGQDLAATDEYSLLKAVFDETERLGGPTGGETEIKTHNIPGSFNAVEYSKKTTEITRNDNENGKFVGNLQNNSSLEYNLNVSVGRKYKLSAQTATGNADRRELFVYCGETSLGTIVIENHEGSWFDFVEREIEFALPAGEQTLRFVSSGAINIADISISLVNTVFSIPAEFNASEYSDKSEEIRVNDDDNGKYLGQLVKDSYFEFMINAEKSGNYILQVEAASGANQPQEFQIYSDKSEVSSGTITVENNAGNWFDFEYRKMSFALEEGEQTLRFVSSGAINVRGIKIDEEECTGDGCGDLVSVTQKSKANSNIISAAINNRAINLLLPSTAKNATVILFDVRGRVLFNKQISASSGTAKIVLPKNTVLNQTVVLQVKTNSGVNFTKKVFVK